jgi:transposase, IS30 family
MARHLTFQEREFLYRLLKAGTPKTGIARLLGRDRSTIYRELQRNTGGRGYRPKRAQRLAEARRRRCRKRPKLDEPVIRRYVEEKLKLRWSPDQIAGRTRRDFPRAPRCRLSRQAIYDWIDRDAPRWKTALRRGGRPPERRGKLADCVRIDGRPEVINRRRRYGDWEGDTIVGKGRRNALVTLVERKSGYLRIGLADDLRAATTTRVVRRRMSDLPESLRRSLTLDNGKEFADHRRLGQALDLEVYFAEPRRPWQRGTNENTNGLLRQYFPKGTDFLRVTHQEVARVERQLNERPRKRLDYRTPAEQLGERLCCV